MRSGEQCVENLSIHALLVVKDEADVLEQVLRSASRWATTIHALDNGSNDGSWELLQALARDAPQLHLVGRWDEPFRDNLRARVYQHVKAGAGRVDWWARLDADEICVVDPRSVLRAVPPWQDSVQGSMYQFHLTDLDAEQAVSDPEGWLRTPLVQRLRWYLNDWSELRFIRDSTTRLWTDTPWPRGSLRMSSAVVPIRHYQYRDPAQITKRLASRAELAEFVHEHGRGTLGWQHVLRPHGDLDYDDGQGPLIARHDPRPTRRSRLRGQVGWALRGGLRRELSRLLPRAS